MRARFVVVGTRGCSDCARTLALLRRETADDPAVAVSHVLAEQAPGLVERVRVRTAPTVLLVDAGPAWSACTPARSTPTWPGPPCATSRSGAAAFDPAGGAR